MVKLFTVAFLLIASLSFAGNVDIICKIPQGQKAVVLSWLQSKGLDVNRGEDGLAITKAEKVIGKVATPVLKDVVTNDKYFRIRMGENFAAKLPDKPNYIPWRSDDLDAEGSFKVEPTATVNTYDINGNITGTRQQAIGGF